MRPSTLSESSLLAVSSMTGMLKSSRSLAVAARPSISGIMMSMSTRSISFSRMLSSASRPVEAVKSS